MINKALNHLKSTVKTIIPMWEKSGTNETLSRSSQSAQARRAVSRGESSDSTLQELQSLLAEI